jgi:hypothetical protein
MKQIYAIIYGNEDDNAGDIFCAATSQEIANQIIEDEIERGTLVQGAFCVKINLFDKFEPLN